MSYCRTDNDSDVYVYCSKLPNAQGEDGYFNIHVAGMKPWPGQEEYSSFDADSDFQAHMKKMPTLCDDLREMLEPDYTPPEGYYEWQAELNEIMSRHWDFHFSPFAGKSFAATSYLGTIELLNHLRAEGLQVPDRAFARLDNDLNNLK